MAGESLGPCPYCGQPHAENVLLCPNTERLLPLEGRLLDGKFRFAKLLGEGGMGAVWKCENVLIKRTVAIKLMHVQFSRDEGVLARFRNEATAAGRVREPARRHICDILDLGSSSLGPYIVMEMLNGSDFAHYVQSHAPVQPALVVMVVRQALVGLHAAHEVGIVHRDLKPENIFLHEPDPGRLLVKLMDFGISKFTEGSEAGKTGMGVLMGTPEYMSPEQTEGAAQVDLRTDIWAIGVILYWALSGHQPFLGNTMAQTLMNVSMREPAPLLQVAPHVSPALAEIVHRCIRKSSAERWSSAAELAQVLAPFEHANEALPFVAYGTHAGAAPTPAPGGTVAAPPVAFGTSPTVGPPASTGPASIGPTPRGPVPVAVPRGSSPTPAGAETFSNELGGAALGSAPTLGGGTDWSAMGDVLEDRPQSNIGSARGLIVGLIAIGGIAVGGGGWYAWRLAASGTPQVIVQAPEIPETKIPETKAEVVEAPPSGAEAGAVVGDEKAAAPGETPEAANDPVVEEVEKPTPPPEDEPEPAPEPKPAGGSSGSKSSGSKSSSSKSSGSKSSTKPPDDAKPSDDDKTDPKKITTTKPPRPTPTTDKTPSNSKESVIRKITKKKPAAN